MRNLLCILILSISTSADDIKNCFISHKNIRISCGKPLETSSSVSLEDCQQICIKFDTQCQTIQYDYYKNVCEIYNVPSPLRINETVADVIRKRESALGNTECALASLQPTIGSSHLIPQWECLSQYITRVQTQKSVVQLIPSQTIVPNNTQTLNIRPIDSNLDRAEKEQKPDIKIKKIGTEKFEIVSNTIGSSGEEKNNQGRTLVMADDSKKSMETNSMKNLAVEVLPVVPDCPMGEHSRVQVIDGVEVDREATVSFTVSSPEQCVQSCRMSTYSDGARLPLLCRSSHFDKTNRKCSLYSDAINPNGYLEYKPNQQVIYMEKICIPDTVLPVACDDVFRRIPQHILLGHASEVLSVASEQECVLECIKSKTLRSVECHSILHYPDFPALNCILNVHTRHTKHHYFTPELSFKVDYVELGACVSISASGSGISALNRIRVPINPFDKHNSREEVGSATVDTEWSEWTVCNEESSTRSRHRHCNGCKDMIQFLPCFTNNNFDLALQKFIKEQQTISETSIKSAKNDRLPVEVVKNDVPLPRHHANVIEFPKKEHDEVVPSKNLVEFFGPPSNSAQQAASHAMSSF